MSDQIPNTPTAPTAPPAPVSPPADTSVIAAGAASGQDEATKRMIDELAQMTAGPVPTLADEIEEIEDKQGDYQSMYDAGGHFKQQVDATARSWKSSGAGEGVGGSVESRPGQEKGAGVAGVEVIPTTPEKLKPELKGYVEKVETEVEVGTGVTDDYTQTVLMGMTNQPPPVVTLPLTEEQVEKALHLQVWESIRWLATWCVRQIKMLHGRVKYKLQ